MTENTNTSYDDIIIELSKDKLAAFITLLPGPDLAPPPFEQVTSKLKELNILYYVKESEIKRVLQDKVYNEKTKIATGIDPVPTENGKVEYLFDAEISKKGLVDKEGNVDFKTIHTIINVNKDDRLARLHPPIPGKDGKTVTGEIIAAGAGQPALLPSGKNVAIDAHDKDILIATEHGAVRIIDSNHIDIDPILDIPGNIDYTTGNIDFSGSLIVRGNILSGFNVQVAGNIEVTGVIEDSVVIAGGDISAIGCVGNGKGKIAAGGSILLQYAENHILQARKNIIVDKYLMNCQAHSDKQVIVTGKNGLIIGGEAIAVDAIEAKTIGTLQETRTVICIGFSLDLRVELAAIEKEQQKNCANIGTIDKALKTISRIAIMKHKLPPELKQQCTELMQAKEKIESSVMRLLEKQDNIIKQMVKTGLAYIKASNDVYPGVIIKFPNIQKVVRSKTSNVKFEVIDNAIKILPGS